MKCSRFWTGSKADFGSSGRQSAHYSGGRSLSRLTSAATIRKPNVAEGMGVLVTPKSWRSGVSAERRKL